VVDSIDIDEDQSIPRVSSINLPANLVKRNVIEKHTKSGEDYSIASSNRSKKNKKKKKRGNGLLDIIEDSDNEPNGSGEGEHSLEDCKNGNIDKLNTDKACESTENAIDDDRSSSSCCEEENSTSNQDVDINHVDDFEADACSAKSNESTDKSKKKKGNKDSNNVDQITGSYSCEICAKIFPTKNKLFKHIKAEGHAVLKEDTRKPKKGKGKKK